MKHVYEFTDRIRQTVAMMERAAGVKPNGKGKVK